MFAFFYWPVRQFRPGHACLGLFLLLDFLHDSFALLTFDPIKRRRGSDLDGGAELAWPRRGDGGGNGRQRRSQVRRTQHGEIRAGIARAAGKIYQHVAAGNLNARDDRRSGRGAGQRRVRRGDDDRRGVTAGGIDRAGTGRPHAITVRVGGHKAAVGKSELFDAPDAIGIAVRNARAPRAGNAVYRVVVEFDVGTIRMRMSDRGRAKARCPRAAQDSLLNGEHTRNHAIYRAKVAVPSTQGGV